MNPPNSRAIVANILSELLSGHGSLTTHLAKHKEQDEFSLIQESCYGVCRWFNVLEHILSGLLNKPLKTSEQNLKCLLICGLYQLRELDVAEYAVINETVSAATVLKKPWAKGLVNAVLRNYLRKKDEIEQALVDSAPAVLQAHPQWLQNQLNKQWPDDAGLIMQNNNLRPPMTLRVNQVHKSRKDYLEVLADSSIQAKPGELAESAIYLEKPCPVSDIPGFAEGWVSVQDEASQLIPPLLQLSAGQRVLDACASPGGKTCHILESEHSLTECLAIDLTETKLVRIKENLERLGLKATLLAADASEVSSWWDGKMFDRILLDAPCSATGIIRRHPDIKLLRKPEDVKALQHIQLNLLSALWQCLEPGGLLLYSTCSILRPENEELIGRFLESSDNAKYEGIAADWGVECRFGRQLLPGGNQGPDGFFFSLLRKT
ncbi:MAG: 16S rRNA (cytosine(967)-C(5))-methyltransferase [SAR86 cluster bacterium]|uniref:16S rRNA (cytosine(967)-C(5))-methyltransferase n=1 Tax=SAR86 cluster bacterium TaxID=2030880 RepID=A0A2A5B8N3_9GAMM|nr:MAG: 16S rRNA (cytosine(967)-C(5))-methyltransferase [SAR86 cluster bacterium]